MFHPKACFVCLAVVSMGVAGGCFAQGQPAAAHGSSSSGYAALVRDAKTRIKEVNIQEFERMKNNGEPVMLVDVREEGEWIAGRAKDALHLSRGILEREIESKAPDKNTKLVLYCGGGSRSALAADSLQKLGYKNVYSLAGGFGAYRKAGLPVDQPLPQ